MNKAFTVKTYFVTIVFLFLFSTINAQVFQKNYAVQGFVPGGHHFTESVHQTGDGGFIFQGWNTTNLLPRMTMVKTRGPANQFTIDWKKEYGKCVMVAGFCTNTIDPSVEVMGGSVKQLPDGSFIATGSMGGKMMLLKTQANGNVSWAKTYGTNNTYGKYVIPTADGGFICVGHSGDFDGTKTYSNVFVVKTQANGNLSWDRVYRFSPNYSDGATEVAQLNNGDYVITGYSTQIYNPGPTADTTTDILLLRLNSAGNFMWGETYGNNSNSEEGQSVRKTSDGGYVVSGTTSQTTHPLSATDVFLWKFSAADAFEFRYSYKVSEMLSLSISFGYAAQETFTPANVSDGYALFGVTTGYGLTSISYFNNFLLKVNPSGDPVFCKAYKDSITGGGTSFNLGYTIWNDGQQLNNRKGYVLTGSGIPLSGAGLGYKLIKTNSIGESGCSESNITPSRYNFAPPAEPHTLTNLSTGSTVTNVDIYANNVNIIEEDMCYISCTAFPGNDTTICQGGSVTLGNGGPNGETAMFGNPPYTYSWSSTPAGFSSNIENPTVSPTVTTTYTLTITDSDACAGTANIVVTISPQPSIHGVTANPQIICEGTSSTLTANADHATTYAWSPATTPANTQTVTASPAATTTYTVTASNSCGSVSANVVVTVVPAPQVNLPPNDTICEGEVYAVPGSLSNYATITWSSSGTGTFSGTNITNPTYTPSAADVTAGTVTLSVSVISNSVTCNDTIVEIELAIMPIPPAPTFSNQLPSLCENAAPLTLTGGTPSGGTYSGPGVSNGQFSPTVAGNGTHTITYTISEFTCENSATNTIIVLPLPNVSLGNFANVCISNNPFLLTGGVPTGGTYSGSGVNDSLYSPILAGTGLDTIYYVFTDSIGCSDTAMATINVIGTVTLTSDAPGNAVYVELGQVVNFTATPNNAGTYNFAIDGVSQQSNTTNTYATNTLQAGQVVSVTLDNACQDTIIINVKPVPNAFIPFTNDGSNDIFMPNVDLKIINRWGQEIYTGTEGWDGKYKGQNVSPGTYFYIIKITDLKGEEKQFTGTVTLVAK